MLLPVVVIMNVTFEIETKGIVLHVYNWASIHTRNRSPGLPTIVIVSSKQISSSSVAIIAVVVVVWTIQLLLRRRCNDMKKRIEFGSRLPSGSSKSYNFFFCWVVVDGDAGDVTFFILNNFQHLIRPTVC